MKKIFNIFITTLCAFGLIALLAPAVTAADRLTCGEGQGRVTAHFAYFDAEIPTNELFFHNWSTTGVNSGKWAKTFEDDFGVYADFCVTAGTASIGLIAVQLPAEKQVPANDYAVEPNWDNLTDRLTSDVIADTTKLVAGGNLDVYFFEYRGVKVDALVADPSMINILVTYCAEQGVYEETLGFHLWGNGYMLGEDITISTTWGTPTVGLFKTVAINSKGAEVKGCMLYIENAAGGAGGLIYAGTDETKKGGAVVTPTQPKNEISASGKEVGKVYEYAAIDEKDYLTAKAVLNAAVDFAPQEIHLMEYKIENGTLSGTYAQSKTVVYVETSLPMATEHEISIYQGTTKVEVESQTSTGKFAVLILKANLDITKEYKVVYIEEGVEDEIVLALDTEKPVIELLGYTKPIEIKLGSKWSSKENQGKFPTYVAIDDRDGDITAKVYVPSGDKCTLNTKKAGTYTILLQVEDRFGNIGTVEFQFIVK